MSITSYMLRLRIILLHPHANPLGLVLTVILSLWVKAQRG